MNLCVSLFTQIRVPILFYSILFAGLLCQISLEIAYHQQKYSCYNAYKPNSNLGATLSLQCLLTESVEKHNK